MFKVIDVGTPVKVVSTVMINGKSVLSATVALKLEELA